MLTADDLRTASVPLADDVVVCLCAEWCGTCRTYRDDFARLAEEFPRHTFVWLDVEDDTDLVGDIDIETFPTVLIAHQGDVLFGGILLPHIQHLDRLLATLDERKALPAGEYSEIVRRLRGG
jgi:thioredoxin 1